jgi:hypothetical protein
MMSLSITSLTEAINVRWWPQHRVLPTLIQGRLKTMRTLLFGYEIRLDFFHDCKITCPTLENLNWQKWTPRDLSKNQLS